MKPEITFDAWVRRRRRALDLTQRALARCAGCSFATIRKIEAGERRPSRQLAERLGACLGVEQQDHSAFLAAARAQPGAALALSVTPNNEQASSQRKPGRLPLPLSSFVGRTKEIAEVEDGLRRSRLVTLTGPGGSGKSRLALQVAHGLIKASGGDVIWVQLAALDHPNAVVPAVAAALGVREEPGHALLESLTWSLQARAMLIVLDNCEHLVLACAEIITSLLQGAETLRVLVTSREALNITGEAVYPLGPLATPTAIDTADWRQLAEADAPRLFIERAQSALPSFAVTHENAAAVAQICRRLDGIPLAIELAAARVRALRVEEISSRLDDRFNLLTSGDRVGLPRHRTLRALVDWSYNYLDQAEQTLLRKLAVFAGGWTLQSAESVCRGPTESGRQGTHATTAPPVSKDIDILDVTGRLVDKSLVVAEMEPLSLLGRDDNVASKARYHLLDTIRQYAREKLAMAGDLSIMRDRHADYFLEFAREMAADLHGPEQRGTLERLVLEIDNLRAALDWYLTRRPLDALVVEASLGEFWSRRATVSEGIRRISAGLHALEHLPDGVLCADGVAGEPVEIRRARAQVSALDALGGLYIANGDFREAREVLREGVVLARALLDGTALVGPLAKLSYAQMFCLELSDAASSAEEALVLADELGNLSLAYIALVARSHLAYRVEGDMARAHSYMMEAIEFARRRGDHWTLGMAEFNAGVLALAGSSFLAAQSHFRQSIAILQQLGDLHFALLARSGLADVLRYGGDYREAVPLYRDLLMAWQQLGAPGRVARCLECLGFIASLEARGSGQIELIQESAGKIELAGRLFGAAEAIRDRVGAVMVGVDRDEYDSILDELSHWLSEVGHTADFRTAWGVGHRLTTEQLLAYGFAPSPADHTPR